MRGWWRVGAVHHLLTYAIPLDLVSSGLPQSQFLTNIIIVLLALYGAKHSSLYVCGIEL